jgi:hypothetical protein
MELNFDKEIDAILRKARESESASVAAANPPSHLDADEISAFAENALPEIAKMRYTAHLADCERCRKILSNVVLLNSETESEIVHADEKTVAAPVADAWYRRLFQFPNLAYSLGALALVFGGIIAFTALQSLDTFQNAEISQVSNKPSEMTKSAPATQSNANFSTSNTANASTANAPANTPPAPLYPSNTAAAPNGLTANSNTNAAFNKPSDMPAITREATKSDSDSTLSKPSKDESFQADGANEKQQKEEERKRAEIAKNSEDDKKTNDQTTTDRTTTQDAPSASGAAKTARTMSEKAKKLGAAEGETTTAGGRTFRRSNNVWYDTAYNNQATTNVTRGTSEYKKLDKDLRVIVENLGGTVIIVWKGKAYRFR